MTRLVGKVALISGAAQGMGAAMARLFVAEGAKVVIADIAEDAGRTLSAELGPAARFAKLDVRSPEQWRMTVAVATETFGGLDVLVNNAGILQLGNVLDTSLEAYREVIEVNQVGCFLGMQAAAPALQARGGGAIVNTSSVAGMKGVAGTFAYSTSKWAVRGMTKSAALDLGCYGIRVNSVHPGAVDTGMIKGHEFAPPAVDSAFSRVAVPRKGRADEVAELTCWLASDGASYCTGTEFVIDGGSLAGSATPAPVMAPSP